MSHHHRPFSMTLVLSLILLPAYTFAADPVSIDIHADRIVGHVPPYMTGACIEDVNHEVYGGIYSQMIFGESFQEPPASGGFKQFTVIDGDWQPAGAGAKVGAGPGPKLVANDVVLDAGQASVDVLFSDQQAGNAGLILKINQARAGADRFIGYEVSLESRGVLVLGRHRNNWEPIRSVPCRTPLNQWIRLSVKIGQKTIEASVDGVRVLAYEDTEHPLPPGGVALRAWQRTAQFQNLEVWTNGQKRVFSFDRDPSGLNGGVSGMWRGFSHGSAEGTCAATADHPFTGAQSQQLAFTAGQGEIGIENRGLNRWGMSFVAGKPYDGYLWLKCDRATAVFVAAESADGVAHRSQIDHSRHAGEILKQHTRGHEGNFFFRGTSGARRVPACEGENIGGVDEAIVFVAQKILEQNFQRERQTRNVADSGARERVQAVNLKRIVSGAKNRAGRE